MCRIPRAPSISFLRAACEYGSARSIADASSSSFDALFTRCNEPGMSCRRIWSSELLMVSRPTYGSHGRDCLRLATPACRTYLDQVGDGLADRLDRARQVRHGVAIFGFFMQDDQPRDLDTDVTQLQTAVNRNSNKHKHKWCYARLPAERPAQVYSRWSSCETRAL